MRFWGWVQCSALACVTALSGCASSTHQHFNYLHQDVKQLPPLQTAPGMGTPYYKPVMHIPEGLSQAAFTQELSLAPPGIHAQVVMPRATPVAVKPAASKRAPIKGGGIEATIERKGPAVGATVVLPKQPSRFVQNKNHKTYVMVQSPWIEAWDHTLAALKTTQYKTVSVDRKNHFIFVVPRGKQALGHTSIVAVTQETKDSTMLSIFNPNGEQSSAPWAIDLLSKIQAYLNGTFSP
jgi:uncharacterized lipoprotein